MWHLELQIKYQNNRGYKSPKWSDASIGTGPDWKPDMSCKSTLWGCTNINSVNICKVFALQILCKSLSFRYTPVFWQEMGLQNP